jgi:hypothetical protein
MKLHSIIIVSALTMGFTVPANGTIHAPIS